MTRGTDQALVDALRALRGALGETPSPAMLIGGLAVIAHGVPRLTADIDVTVAAERLDLDAFVGTLARHELVPRIADALVFARRTQVLLLRHAPTGVPLDVSLAWLPFELEALERAESIDFGGVSLPVASAEDLVVFKAVAWRDRDRSDVERLLAMHLRGIDVGRVRRLVEEFAALLDDPGRLAEFDEIVERARRASGQ